MAMTGRERRRLACHEAGHAVVATALGLTVEWIAIDQEHRSGVTYTSASRGSETTTDDLLATLVAGAAAEHGPTPGAIAHAVTRGSARHDARMGLYFLREYESWSGASLEEVQRAMVGALPRACQILTDHREQALAIADELMLADEIEFLAIG